MKKSDIKRAYDSVSSGDELKEKIFARLEMEKKIFTEKETSHIKLKNGGSHYFTTAGNMHRRCNGSRAVPYASYVSIIYCKFGFSYIIFLL